MPQMGLAEDDKVVEALPPDTLHNTLGHSILIRRPHADQLDFDPPHLPDGIDSRTSLLSQSRNRWFGFTGSWSKSVAMLRTCRTIQARSGLAVIPTRWTRRLPT